MYTFIENQKSLTICGVLTYEAVGELAATLNEKFKIQDEIILDLNRLQDLNLKTVVKLVQLQENYSSCRKRIVFRGLQNNSVRGSFGLAGKKQLLQPAV